MPRKTPPSPGSPARQAGFNEAAARCRGKPAAASSPPPAARGFNEAAARCRGKRHPPGRRGGCAGAGFNEAAARCRGKPSTPRARRAGRTAASMRPRPDAAENLTGEGRDIVPGLASMRPRPDAAENDDAGRNERRSTWSFNEAAARCRGKRTTASARSGRPTGFNEAAARCRGKLWNPDTGTRGQGRFNEAAARCRGKLERVVLFLTGLTLASMRPRPDAAENPRSSAGGGCKRRASMRPRPDAAENPDRRHDQRSLAVRFNEAAARCRGKRAPLDGFVRAVQRFNEAAARCRGKHADRLDLGRDELAASMRPRPDAAENSAPPGTAP